MGFWDTISDLASAAAPWSTVEAESSESPKESVSGGQGTDSTPANNGGEGEAADASGSADKQSNDVDEDGNAAGGADDVEGEEEEEEEEEIEDPKEKFEEECRNSKQCAPYKHHYDECVARVTGAADSDSKVKEDCVEEFFHLTHCATACAAPKVFAALK